MQMIWMRNTNVINPLKGHHQSQVKLLKIKLFMKVVKKVIYVAVALFCLNLTVSAQSITLKVSNITVKQAMDELKSRSGYSFVFSSADVDTGKKISVSAESWTRTWILLISSQKDIRQTAIPTTIRNI